MMRRKRRRKREPLGRVPISICSNMRLSYEVEAIRDHEWKKKKGKGQPWVLLYNVKWKNYPDSDNTLEPEENLL